jgi:NADP-dependent 3-hydroxy acid dehydrogenase YdfG
MSRVVLVTGAASGIGAGLAAHFIKIGDQVVALDMNRAGLASLADRLNNPNLLPAVADVTDDARLENAPADAPRASAIRRCLLTMPAPLAARERRLLARNPTRGVRPRPRCEPA